MKISILDLIGKVCMTTADGERLHDTLRPAFDAGETVELDFAGTEIFVTPFFNASIGRLLERYTREEIRARLLVTNLADAGRDPLRHSVDNAERYYKDPAYREALDRVLLAHAAEA